MPSPALRIEPNWPRLIGWENNGQPVFSRYYGKRHDFGSVPFTYDDLGARIVAEELADLLYAEYERCDRLGLHDMARKADEAHYELLCIAQCDDDDTRAYIAECNDAYEARPYVPAVRFA